MCSQWVADRPSHSLGLGGVMGRGSGGGGGRCQLRSMRLDSYSYLKVFPALSSVTLLLCMGMDFFVSHRNEKVCIIWRLLLSDVCII